MTENSLIAPGCDFWVMDYISCPGLNICVTVSLPVSFTRTDYPLKGITSPYKFLGPHQQKVVPPRYHKRAFHPSSHILKSLHQQQFAWRGNELGNLSAEGSSAAHPYRVTLRR